MNKNLTVLALLSVFGSLSGICRADGSGPASGHIGGLSDRLKSITCTGAYVTTMSDFKKRVTPAIEAACDAIKDSNASTACMNAMIKNMTRFSPNAVFLGVPAAADYQFQLTITEDGKNRLSSLRSATHGDTADAGSTLIFLSPPGLSDDYMIETSPVADDNTIASVSVPVRRRMAADLIFNFVDGCKTVWDESNP